MGRLFDAGVENQQAEVQRAHNDGVRARAAAVDDALREIADLDEASKKLGTQLAEAQAIQPIVYTTFRQPGKRWLIEHAQVGADYIYQLFPLRPPHLNWKDVIAHMIGAMDVIFPRTVKITYVPPHEGYQVKFYTVRLDGVTEVPGWERAVGDRTLHALAGLDVWPV